MKITATLWNWGRCWSVSTWRIWESRLTLATTSSTDVVNWRKWDSKTRDQSPNLSGEPPTRTPACDVGVQFTCSATRWAPPLRRCRFKLCGCSLQQTYEAKRQEFLVELQKREDEMRQMFVQRVKEKEAELKDAEREVSGCNGRCRLQKSIFFNEELICWTFQSFLPGGIPVTYLFFLFPSSCKVVLSSWSASMQMRRRLWRKRRDS